jgi:hypothetical protein
MSATRKKRIELFETKLLEQIEASEKGLVGVEKFLRKFSYETGLTMRRCREYAEIVMEGSEELATDYNLDHGQVFYKVKGAT